MDVVEGLRQGFVVALTPQNLLLCLLGVLWGTAIGVLPGIGPIVGIGLLLPFSFGLDPTGALILLAGVFYGAQYGGSTTSILVNVPGEATAVVTALDGYQLARQGRAGPALSIAAIGSFVAGTIGVIGLMFLASALVPLALGLGPPEYFALIVVGLTMVAYLSHGSTAKALLMGLFGLALATVGLDPVVNRPRFTYGFIELWDGFSLVPVILGLFALPELLDNLRHGFGRPVYQKIQRLWPAPADLRQSALPIVRGSLLGFLIGILPGAGVLMSTFASYALERRLAKDPSRFGRGAIEGVAGPEAANNAATSGALVPLLALGLPANPVTAIMLGAFVIHGLRPGPLLMQQQPDLFWGLVASMYVGNVLLLVLNLPLVGVWASLLRVPYRVLMPIILVCCFIGAYATNNRMADVWIMLAFGALGYGMRRLELPAAPVILAFVLGETLEISLRQSLILGNGSPSIFFTRPTAAALLGLALVLILVPILGRFGANRRPPSPSLSGGPRSVSEDAS